MIAQLLLQKLQANYQDFLDKDRFESLYPSQDCQLEGHPSMRNLLQDILSFKPDSDSPLHFPAFPNLDITFAQFLQTPFTHGTGKRLPLEAAVYSMFCWDAVKLVVRDAFIFSVTPEGEEEERALIAESAFHSAKDLQKYLKEQETVAWLADLFLAQMKKSWGHLALRAFFHVEPSPIGYLNWWPGARTGVGTALKSKVLVTPVGKTEVHVSRYEDMETGIKAYEWNAELRSRPDSEVPDAIACGMVYVFERDGEGGPYSGTDSLLATADAVADTDVLQVRSFLDQHDDADELIFESDLCFVWLWERRADMPKGVGGECLRAAIKDVKSRFRKVKTVIVDVRPSQFKSWTDPIIDPPLIELAKQEAIEAVHSRLNELDLDKLVAGEMRCIVNNHGSDPDEALAALIRD